MTDGIGEAYKLIHVQSGRSIKSLVSGDRLKHYEVDNREKLTERLPGVSAPPSEVKPVNDRNDGFEPAIRITRQRVKDRQREYHHRLLLRQKAAKYHIRTQNTHTKYDTKLHIGTHIHTVKH